jgi:plastocyanin
MSIEFSDPSQPPAPSSSFLSRWKMILIVLAVAALAMVVYLTEIRNNSHRVSALTDGQISISSNGFFPATVVVSRGQTITWVNYDSSPHWIFADPYPTGSSLPGLDSIDALGQNDSYSFKFNSSGKYTYHDQLHPYKLHGTVEVK